MDEFITINFETAAKSPESAISIGMVKYRNYWPISSYYSIIRPPELNVYPDFTVLRGFPISDIKNAPDFKYLWKKEIKGFIGKTMLAAYHASFDMSVLRAILEWYGLPIPKLQYFCTLKLITHVWPKLESYALPTLRDNFLIIHDTYNILEDAAACGSLIQMASEEFEEGKNIKGLLEYFSVEIKWL